MGAGRRRSSSSRSEAQSTSPSKWGRTRASQCSAGRSSSPGTRWDSTSVRTPACEAIAPRVLRRAVRAGQMSHHGVAVREVANLLGHPLEVDGLVDQDIGAGRQPSDVVAGAGVAGEHHRSTGRVEAVGERREDRSVLHEDGGDPNAVLVLRQDLHGIHRGSGGCRRLTAGDHPEVDVGRRPVSRHADLTNGDAIREVLPSFGGDADVDVVRVSSELVLHHRGRPRRRLLGPEETGDHPIDGLWRGQHRRAGPEDLHGVVGPEPEEQVGEVDHMVRVQVGQEDRVPRSPRPWGCDPGASRSPLARAGDAHPRRSR